jgi:phage regulator Rha-like protein
MKKGIAKVPHTKVENAIQIVRNEKVILDTDLANLYGVENRALIQSVKRNIRRFPPDFVFQLTKPESDSLRSQIVISKGRGGRRTLPYAFTEHGAIMVANLLNSERAIEASVQVVRAFVRLRTMVQTNTELAKRLDELEKRYDEHFKIVFTAIRQLMTPPQTKKKTIGFQVKSLKK